MDRMRFIALRDEHYEQIAKINDAKGQDYAGHEDALANFKEAANRLGLRPEQVWAVYADKHWSAIMSYCRTGRLESEPIEGRLHDAILYCFLLLGIIAEDAEPAEDDPTTEMTTPLWDDSSTRQPRPDAHPEYAEAQEASRRARQARESEAGDLEAARRAIDKYGPPPPGEGTHPLQRHRDSMG